MKTLILLTAFLTASPVAPTSDPLMNVYLDQYLGVKVVPHKVSKKYFYRQIEFNTKFISSVVGPENLVTGMMNVDTNKKFTASYSVHASPKKLKEKVYVDSLIIVAKNAHIESQKKQIKVLEIITKE